MLEYKLSQNIIIKGFENYSDENIPQQYREGNYILNNKINDKEYIINETIKYYIDKFTPPKTPAEVLKLIEDELQNHSNELEEKCSSFFEFLSDKQILIPTDLEEKIISADAFYKVGDRIDNFNIEKILSQSTVLDVYMVTDSTDGMLKVIKALHKNKVIDEDVYLSELEDLENEFALLQKVKNIPSICQAHALNKNNEQAYIVFEYFEGKSLSRFLRTSQDLTTADHLQLIKNVLEVFSLIHQNKLVHGDIHSSNILVSENKQIKIIDLGLSHIMEFENNEVPIFGGVNYYMPPERINISSYKKYLKQPDLYSDVYQIGLLMYLILYNDLPFKGFIWEELAKNIKEQNIIFNKISYKQFNISRPLISIIKKCLDKNPEKRYKNASIILDDYKKYIVEQKEMSII